MPAKAHLLVAVNNMLMATRYMLYTQGTLVQRTK